MAWTPGTGGGRECTRCGKCCLKYDISPSGEDVKRWIREKRWDILEHVMILGDDDDPWGDIVGPTSRCPFLRKDNGKNTYKCRIHETRPQVCRDYEPWAEGTICEEVKE